MKKLSYISVTILLLCFNNLNSKPRDNCNKRAKEIKSARGVAKGSYIPNGTINLPAPNIVPKQEQHQPSMPFQMGDDWESLPSTGTPNPAQSGERLWPANVANIA